MVAAAKLRRAQDAIVAARPYAYGLADLVRHLLPRVDRDVLPVTMKRDEIERVLIIVVTADRGLCGAFNTNLIRHAKRRIHETYGRQYEAGNVSLLCIGRRGLAHFGKRDYNVVGQHVGLVNDASHLEATLIMENILERYINSEYDLVEAVYNEFKSVVQQQVRHEQLLPLTEETITEADEKYHHFIDYIYEPSELDVLEYLIPKHLNYQMYRILMESNAAEQGARMTAMDAATTNARDLMHALKLSYNRARQASITTEILEIVSGANALRQ